MIVYTPEMLKNAINEFESPYGVVSMIEKVASMNVCCVSGCLIGRDGDGGERLMFPAGAGGVRGGRVCGSRDRDGEAEESMRVALVGHRQDHLHQHRGDPPPLLHPSMGWFVSIPQ